MLKSIVEFVTKDKKASYSKKHRKYKKYNCIICDKECTAIDDYRSRGESRYNKTCKSAECKKQNSRNNDNKYNEKKRNAFHLLKKGDDKIHDFFVGKQDLYKDKLIKYDSPTNTAYIGLAKKPLMPNDNFGYKGVILQSENRSLIQCSECGAWYHLIPHAHLATHGLNRAEYNLKYGLNKTQALVSDTYSRFYATNIVKSIHNKDTITEEQRAEWRNRGRATNPRKKGETYNTIQMQNNYGTCDLQIKDKLIQYIKGHHRYPPANRYSYPVLKRKFGSINNAFKEYGLPTRKQMGYTVLYEFNDGSTHKIISGKGYEELYDLMKLKCPILNTETCQI